MRRILIVEDEAIMRDSLRDWLADVGYDVATAKDGDEALKTISEQEFNLAILDLRLPGKDGIEVLKEAKVKTPHLKGVIITAYPSVQTAVAAIKEGAVEYMPKPFDLNELEKVIRQALGPVQVEIRAPAKEGGAATVEAAEPAITVAPGEVPAHIKLGKEYFEAGKYHEALQQFQAILATAPGNIETRVWLKKTIEAMVNPVVDAGTEVKEARQKECLWMRMGMVAHRICTNEYNCISCEFDQAMQEKMAAGDTEAEAALEKLKALPGTQRLCRYAVKGDLSYRICSRIFQCATCEFGQMMEEVTQQKLARLAARREALAKKDSKKA